MRTNYLIFLTCLLVISTIPLSAQNGRIEYPLDYKNELKGKLIQNISKNERIQTLQLLLDIGHSWKEGMNYITELDSLTNSFTGLNYRKYSAYKEAVKYILAKEFDKGIFFAKEFVNECDKEQLIVGLGTPLAELRNLFKAANKPEELKKYYIEKLQFYEENGPEENMAMCYHGIGSYYYYKGDYNNAIGSYLKAKNFFKDHIYHYGVELAAAGACYNLWGNREKALEYLTAAIPLYKQTNSYHSLSYVKINIARTYISLKRYDMALKECLESVELLRINNGLNEFKAATQLDIAYTYLLLDNTQLGEPYLLRAKVLRDSFNIPIGNTSGNFEVDYISYLYADKKGNPLEAEQYLLKALNQSAELPLLFKKYLKELAFFYNKTGQYKKALSYSINLLSVSDSISQINNENVIAEYEMEQNKRESEMHIQEVVDSRKTQANTLFSVISVLLLLSGLIYGRLRSIRKTKTIIEREKKRSDDLLLNILPVQIAEELKENGEVATKEHQDVAVIFSDFESFTQVTRKMPAVNLVQELNICFKAFDEIMTQFKIEKIKTIGDAYMAVSGIPSHHEEAVKNAVLAGITMQKFIKDRMNKNPHLSTFKMRLGIHTGNLVAGVVGTKKFQYDVWGDSVNIASRIEANGLVGEVCVSKDIIERIGHDPSFTFESIGFTEIKGSSNSIELYKVFLN